MTKLFISYPKRLKSSFFFDKLRDEFELNNISIINGLYESSFFLEDIASFIPNAIKKSDVLLAILDSSNNSSIFLELGCAVGLGIPIVIVGPIEYDLPMHLKFFPYISYEVLDSKLVYDIIVSVKQNERDKKKIDRSELATKETEMGNKVIDFNEMDGREFENYMFQWFSDKGHNPQRADLTARDIGYDFLIGGEKEKILVEVKKYNSNSMVSVKQIMQLLGAIHAYKATGGIFVTTSGYTQSAKDFATNCSPQITLWETKDLI